MTNTKNQPGRPRTAAKSMFHLTPETQGVYKATLAAVILVVGLLAVRLPFGMRLDAARANRDQQQRLVEDLLEVQAMMDVARVYRDRLTEADDVVVWQEYVQRQLELAGGRLLEFVPGVPISSGKGAILTWEGVQPQLNKPYILQVFVTLLRGWGVFLVALGEKDAVMARQKELRAVFDSFGCTEGKIDRKLVGAWKLVSETSITNKSPFETDVSRARAVATHKTTLTLNADGSFVRVYRYHMIAMGSGVALESKDEKVSRGRWSASGGKLYLIYQDQKWSSFDYRLKPAQGGRELRLVDGKRLGVWAGK